MIHENKVEESGNNLEVIDLELEDTEKEVFICAELCMNPW